MTGTPTKEKKVMIIDYGMGNAGSVENALEALGIPVFVSARPEDAANASHLILPGVGSFAECMKNLEKLGFIPVLNEEVRKKGKPFLGICLGMQILADRGEEGGETAGLGWIAGRTRRFKVDEAKFHLPHVGWNDVTVKGKGTLFQGISRPIFYFVHSFHLVPKDRNVIGGETEYGETFAAAVGQRNIFGVQFHPEKSQHAGLKLLENFIKLT